MRARPPRVPLRSTSPRVTDNQHCSEQLEHAAETANKPAQRKSCHLLIMSYSFSTEEAREGETPLWCQLFEDVKFPKTSVLGHSTPGPYYRAARINRKKAMGSEMPGTNQKVSTECPHCEDTEATVPKETSGCNSREAEEGFLWGGCVCFILVSSGP